MLWTSSLNNEERNLVAIVFSFSYETERELRMNLIHLQMPMPSKHLRPVLLEFVVKNTRMNIRLLRLYWILCLQFSHNWKHLVICWNMFYFETIRPSEFIYLKIMIFICHFFRQFMEIEAYQKWEIPPLIFFFLCQGLTIALLFLYEQLRRLTKENVLHRLPLDYITFN